MSSFGSRFVRALVVGVALVASACGDPPDREMQQAQGAIDAARAAGAETYAVEQFNSAQQALKDAQVAVDAGDYRLALSHAVDSRDWAQQAARTAADGLAAARVEADRAITRLSDAIEAARASMKTAGAGRPQAKVVAAVGETLSHADEQLQEARTAFDSANYGRVMSIVSQALGPVQAAAADLATMQSPVTRRTR
jgi:hypothetical protein